MENITTGNFETNFSPEFLQSLGRMTANAGVLEHILILALKRLRAKDEPDITLEKAQNEYQNKTLGQLISHLESALAEADDTYLEEKGLKIVQEIKKINTRRNDHIHALFILSDIGTIRLRKLSADPICSKDIEIFAQEILDIAKELDELTKPLPDNYSALKTCQSYSLGATCIVKDFNTFKDLE